MAEKHVKTCPDCGAEKVSEPFTDYKYACGSEWCFDGFVQSDLCKLRQRDALIGDLLALIDNYATHHDGCPNRRGISCTCGVVQKLAALKARAERLKP